MATRKQRLQVLGFLFASGLLILLIIYFVSGMYSNYGVKYWIEFDESILGVYEGGVVVYLGVPVGKVDEITVNEEGKPRVVIDIDTRKVRLHEGVEANLVIYSLAAGTMAVSLSGGDPKKPELPPGSKIPARMSMISSVSSQLEVLISDTKEIIDSVKRGLEGLGSGDITALTKRLDKVLEQGEELLEKFNGTVERVKNVVESLEPKIIQTFDTADNTLNSIHETSNKVDKLVETLNNKIEEIKVNELQQKINENLNEIRRLSENLNSFVVDLKELSGSLSYKADNVGYSLNKTLLEMSRTLESLRSLLESLQSNPSSIFRGRSSPKREE